MWWALPPYPWLAFVLKAKGKSLQILEYVDICPNNPLIIAIC
jgi:hypothetical protein